MFFSIDSMSGKGAGRGRGRGRGQNHGAGQQEQPGRLKQQQQQQGRPQQQQQQHQQQPQQQQGRPQQQPQQQQGRPQQQQQPQQQQGHQQQQQQGHQQQQQQGRPQQQQQPQQQQGHQQQQQQGRPQQQQPPQQQGQGRPQLQQPPQQQGRPQQQPPQQQGHPQQQPPQQQGRPQQQPPQQHQQPAEFQTRHGPVTEPAASRPEAVTSQLEREVSELNLAEGPTGDSGACAVGSSSREFLPVSCVSDQRRRQLPKRPDKGGQKGRQISLLVNHFDFKFDPNLSVFMYDFEIQPCGGGNKSRQKGKTHELRRSLCEAVMLAFMAKFFPKIYRYRYVYDGRRVAYFLDKLPGVGPDGFHGRVCLLKDNGIDEEEFSVTLVQSRTPMRHFGDIKEYLTTETGTADIPVDAIRVVDILLKATFIEKSMVPIGNRALFFEKYVPLGQQDGDLPWVMHQGLFASLRPQWSVRLNVDNTQVACYPSKNLADILYDIGKSKRWRDDVWNRELVDKDRITLAKMVKMCRVEASHYKNKEGKPFSRKHTIFDLKKSPATTQITLENKSRVTIAQYFKQQYGINLKYPYMPCVKASREKDTLLPVELCTMLPYQKPPDKDGDVVSAIIRRAAVPAAQRRGEIEDRLNRLGLDQSQYLREFKISINTKMLKLFGRVLSSPSIGYAKNQSVRLDRGPGKWDARNATYLEPGQVKRWAFVNLDDRVRDDMPFFRMLTQMAGRNGISLREDNCEYVNVKNSVGRVNADFIDKTFRELKAKAVELAMFVINPFDKESYRTVKCCGDRKYGIVSQAVLSKNVEGARAPSDQTVGNILLKINGKLGGVNWFVDSLLRDLNAAGQAIIRVPTIVFGADVTHPSPTGDRAIRKSIAAVVASMDTNYTKYAAEFREQMTVKGNQTNAVKEVIDDMKGVVKALLLKFYQRSKMKPVSIIFYRDGVSEGQFTEVLGHEVAAIQQACSEMAPGNDYEPKITFVIVGKRHHTRFFPTDQRDAVGKSGNCPAGTVVDTEIVHRREFNFYLQSHEGIQGTSKPSLYHVLWDDNRWSSDDLQMFTYYLCHVYMRCTRSVSIPAPVYYAHLCADRGRTWMGEDTGSETASVSSRQSASTAARAADPVRLEEIRTSYPENSESMFFL